MFSYKRSSVSATVCPPALKPSKAFLISLYGVNNLLDTNFLVYSISSGFTFELSILNNESNIVLAKIPLFFNPATSIGSLPYPT
jgi:hypothetical protein